MDIFSEIRRNELIFFCKVEDNSKFLFKNKQSIHVQKNSTLFLLEHATSILMRTQSVRLVSSRVGEKPKGKAKEKVSHGHRETSGGGGGISPP